MKPYVKMAWSIWTALVLIYLIYLIQGNAMAADATAEYGKPSAYQTGLVTKSPVLLRYRHFSLKFVRPEKDKGLLLFEVVSGTGKKQEVDVFSTKLAPVERTP